MSSPKQRKKFTNLKSTVIALRKKGRTYSEIRKVYNIPKSTLSDWLKNVKISLRIRKAMKGRSYEKWKKGNEIFIKKRIKDAAKARERYKKKASKEIKSLSAKDLKLIGSVLYWAEGSNKNRNCLRFANSNSEVIRIIMKFFREVCHISDKKIKARAHIYPGNDYSKTLKFWRKIVKLPSKNFYKPQIQVSRASKGKRKRNTLPYGTLHLTAGNTEIASKVKGWIRGISENF